MLRPTNHLKAGGSVVAWMLVVRGLTVALVGSTAIAFAQNSPNVPPGNLTPSQPGLLLPQPGNRNIGIPSQNIPGARELKKTGSDETKKDTKKKTQPSAAEAARVSPARIAPNVATDLADRSAVQARIERGLSPEILAACRRAANNLAPRLGSLLSGPDWESRLLVAIVSEWKEVGVSFDKAEELARQSKEEKSRRTDERASRVDKGGEAEALRGEAAEIKATAAAVSAAIAVAGATVATVPQVGTVIGAIIHVIAAILMYLEQLLEKGEQSAADAKKKEGEASAAEIAERLRRTKLRLVMQMESQKDDDLSAK
jgi:hypothetical protein